MKSVKLVFLRRVLFASLLVLVTAIAPAKTPYSHASDRIVSVGGSVTEILYALGAQQQIVAADTSSLYPAQVSQLPKVGYYRQLSVEGILAMQPTHLFAAMGVGPTEVLTQLSNAGVQVHVFEQARTVAGLLNMIHEIGQRAGLQAQAEQLQKHVKDQLSAIKKINIKPEQRAVFLMSAGERGIMAAGKNTVPNLIMKIAGLGNPYDNIEGFKPVSIESFLAIAPTQVLIAEHRTGGLSASELCKQPALEKWAQAQGCNLHIVDALLFLGLTPRLPDAVAQFAHILEQ